MDKEENERLKTRLRWAIGHYTKATEELRDWPVLSAEEEALIARIEANVAEWRAQLAGLEMATG